MDNLCTISADGRPNQGCDYREQLGPAAAGQGLLDYLSRRYPHSTKEEWAGRIGQGLVLLDGVAAAGDPLLRAGQQLVWQRPPWIEPDAPLHCEIIHQDDELLAVAKPAGLPTLPGANFYEHSLLRLVQRQVPQAVPLHRLGRWTSGLVLCACTESARRELLCQWSRHQVAKRYRALVAGQPPWERLVIEQPIGPVPHPLLGSLHAASPDGKAARSEVTVLERRAEGCLCDVAIDTGRPHQIRIHMAWAGFPLLGDPLYLPGGVPSPDSRALPGDPGYLLHSAELGFRHPRDGRLLRLVAPAPCRLSTRQEQLVPREDCGMPLVRRPT